MSRFFYPDRPDDPFEGVALRDLNNGWWRVTERFAYQYNEHLTIVVPAGFVTDMFSIPRPARWLIPKVLKRGNAASIVHDYMICELHRTHSRQLADSVFIRAMRQLGVRVTRMWLIGRGVQLYTWWVPLRDAIFK